jgi:hypothetical protein
LTPYLIEFIRAREHEATERLLLSASRYPGVEMPFVVEQIIARRQAREKLPSWHAERRLVYPSRLSVEQCSSEVTAAYKRRLVTGDRACDLTGGLGVDAHALSGAAREVIYVERDDACCLAARANFDVLGATNITVLHEEAARAAARVAADTFYLDPSRRAAGNRRVFALADCEPDVLQLKALLLERARRVIVKCSPMADITGSLRLLPESEEVHVLSVRNECKELLFVLGCGHRPGEIPLHAVNVTATGEEQHLAFTPREEREALPRPAGRVEEYLYEPNSALLKAGAFKTVATRFDLAKLHPSSHLYTSARRAGHFPGRVFVVDEVVDFSGKALARLARRFPRARLATRNFPLTVDALRQKSGIAEGGDAYLFATTLAPRGTVLLLCHKAGE